MNSMVDATQSFVLFTKLPPRMSISFEKGHVMDWATSSGTGLIRFIRSKAATALISLLPRQSMACVILLK